MLSRRVVKVAANFISVNASCNRKAGGHLLHLHDLTLMMMRKITYCYMNYSTFGTVEIGSGHSSGKTTLAKDLACLIEESSDLKERRPRSRMELKRFLEHRIKKKVKEQYLNGRFHNLLMKVVADPDTLKDAYNCIRLNSNVDIIEQSCDIDFDLLSEQLGGGNFDVSENTFSISTKGPKKKKEILVLPKLKLKIVQEAIRVVLEVVYKPHFSKLSHGCRSGRGHHTAFKYISKKLSHGNWWFALNIQQKLDSGILAKIFSIMEEHIEDPSLFHFIQAMFDACALNVEFGGFPKGHGLPQEGVLCPIFLNIYLGYFDREFSKLSLKYEALEPGVEGGGDVRSSYLRRWFRRQLKDSKNKDIGEKNPGSRIHCCRFIDELFFIISGCKETAIALKLEIEDYFHKSLQLEVGGETEILPCAGPQAIRFLGSLLQMEESPATRAVHKLKEKVSLFACQKQEAWTMGTLRIGKKWLALGLKKVKESEIKHLAGSSPLLSQISRFRKGGMKTDHWYKLLLKVWMQDVNAKAAKSEQILSKFIAESAIPQELKDSFYEFQKCAEDYVQSETEKTLALLSNTERLSNRNNFKSIAPVNVIRKRLLRYGLTTSKGHPCMVPELILQDHDQIIDWFSGIVERLCSWYGDYDNFTDLELTIGDQVRKSCIRTLAVKYRIHESIIERRFDSELCKMLPGGDADQEKEHGTSSLSAIDRDEGLMYGISYSGQCLLSLARIVSQSRPCNCFVTGCSAAARSVYTLHVMERQKFPGWKTGFSACIHPSLNRRKIGLCRQHLKGLYLGSISLQCIDFSSWK